MSQFARACCLASQQPLVEALAPMLAHLGPSARQLSTAPTIGQSTTTDRAPQHPVQTFLKQQVEAGALQADESQAAAARALDELFASMVAQLHRPMLAPSAPVQQQQVQEALDTGQAQQAQVALEIEQRQWWRDREEPLQPVQQPPQQGNVGEGAAGLNGQGSGLEELPPVQGAYLWGEVGSGKTLLMDAFQRAAAALQPPRAPTPPQQQPHPQPQPKQAQQQQPPAQQSPQAQQQAQVPPPLLPQQGEAPGMRPAVRRTHFHAFMLDVHKRMHVLHQRVPRVARKSRQGLPVYRYAPVLDDPVRLVGHELAQEAQLLCLDELHVTDVADALILNKLFGGILERGTWVVFTSNRPPQDLYKGGLSRKYFEPFIHLIRRRLQVVRVGGGVDYRQLSGQAGPQPLSASAASATVSAPAAAARPAAIAVASRGAAAARGLRIVGPAVEAGPRLRREWELWLQWYAGAQLLPGGTKLSVGFGRVLHLPLVARRSKAIAAYLTFDQLCGRHGIEGSGRASGAALGPTDFVALASRATTLFLEGVPVLRPAQRDEARRFLTLVDVLYDYGVELYCSMEATPADTFLPLLAAAKARGVDPNLGVTKGTALEVPSLSLPSPADRDPEDRTTRAMLEEEVLMYQRAMSRLQEMTTV